MNHYPNFLGPALTYHETLPQRIRRYLNGRGIPDETINSNLLGWNGQRITIPIYNREGKVTSFRMAKDPEDKRPGPKMFSTSGSTVELYGWDQVLKRPDQIVICEGEFDRLVLEANGFPAVTSTGGAATFRREWADELKAIEQVYMCFDRDEAGKRGTMVVGVMMPLAKVVELPEEVGQGGDVTDFFARLGRTREDFLKLLEQAKPIESVSRLAVRTPATPYALPRDRNAGSPLIRRIRRVKSQVPIAEVVGRYVTLRPSRDYLLGLCPFHDDHTPSFVVYPSTRSFHCFGCGIHGDAISFIREVEHLSFVQALEVLDEFAFRSGSESQ